MYIIGLRNFLLYLRIREWKLTWFGCGREPWSLKIDVDGSNGE